MTEEEAKTKWCPMARTVLGRWDGEKLHVDAPSPVHNRYTTDLGEYRIPSGAVCIGSACMAWRWELRTLSKRPNDKGFCGLAGKP